MDRPGVRQFLLAGRYTGWAVDLLAGGQFGIEPSVRQRRLGRRPRDLFARRPFVQSLNHNPLNMVALPDLGLVIDGS